MRQISEEFILSGTHMCGYVEEEYTEYLSLMTWVLSTAWAVLALCLAVWIAIKHLQRPSTPAGWTFFTAVIKTHVFYFARSGRNLDVTIFSYSHSTIVVPFNLVICGSRYANLPLTHLHLTIHHNFHRSHNHTWDLKSFIVFFKFPQSYRCSCWGHASSLAYENVTPSVTYSDEGADVAPIVFQEHLHISTGGGM